MKVISILAQKGGVGKTTLALHWAVEALRQKRGPVAVVDMDVQQSAINWFHRRAGDSPTVLQANAGNVATAVEACRDNGFKLVLLDTMPRAENSSVEAAKVADLAVIPCGPSVLDVEAVAASIAITERVGTPAVIVLNQGRHSSNINDQAMKALGQYGLPICPVAVMRRAALEDAFIDGRAVAELEPNGRAAAEMTSSWNWISKQLAR